MIRERRTGNVNEYVQRITLSDATGGTFRLAFQGQTTAPIAYNASAATVDSALEAVKTIGSGSVSVSLASGVYTVTFSGGSLQHTDVNSLQGDVSSATYGTVDRTITTTYDAVAFDQACQGASVFSRGARSLMVTQCHL